MQRLLARRCCFHTSICTSSSSPTKRAAREAVRASRALLRGGPSSLAPPARAAPPAPSPLPARLLGFTLRPLTVALVGLPNVGKSSLFNRLVRSRLAIVNSQPGTTRDWKEAPGQLGELRLTVLDTGGLEGRASGGGGGGAAAPLEARMLQHTEAALRGADVVLYVIDAREGVRGDDERFVRWVKARREGGAGSVLLVANKAEGMAPEGGAAAELAERAHCLGLGEPLLMSADHGEGLGALYAALEPFALQREEGVAPGAPPASPATPPALLAAPPPPPAGVTSAVAARLARSASGVIHLAVVGRPNVGKSTLVNQLLGHARCLVGPTPGLTRDAVEGVLPLPGGGALRLVDTAGMRRAGASDFTTPLEGLATGQAKRALALANVVALVADGSGGAAAGLSVAPMQFYRGVGAYGGARSLLNAPADAVAAAAERVAGAAGQAPAGALVPRASRAQRAPGLAGRVFGLTRQDLAIAAQVISEGRGLVVVVNKCDAAGAGVAAGVARVVRAQLDRLPDAKGAAVVPVSALRGAGVGELLPAVRATYAAWCSRVPTGRLNAWLALVMRRSPPPSIARSVRRGAGAVGRRARGAASGGGGGGGGGGGASGGDGDAFAAAAPLPLRIKYITQVNSRPPTFAAFVNHAARFPETYKRFLVNSLREEFALWGVPVRLLLRTRENPFSPRRAAAAGAPAAGGAAAGGAARRRLAPAPRAEASAAAPRKRAAARSGRGAGSSARGRRGPRAKGGRGAGGARAAAKRAADK
jgi:ribosome-associated GTPase EngA